MLVTGHTGMVGSRFVELVGQRYQIMRAGRSQESDVPLELTRESSVMSAIQRSRPDVVVNFAAVTDVDACEREKENEHGSAYQTNVLGPTYLARACRGVGARLIHISTDYVFSGNKRGLLYKESDEPRPINWYGTTKYLGEQAILSETSQACIVRVAFPFTARFAGKSDLVRKIIDTLRAGKTFNAVSNNEITPTFADDVAAALEVLINNNATGIYHVSGTAAWSVQEIARHVADVFNLDKTKVAPITHTEFQAMPGRAPRPQYGGLSIELFETRFGNNILRTLPQSLEILHRQMESK